LIPFTLRQLQYFVSAAEHGGTAQAATAMNVSQPSVSMAIKQLEEALGESLFVRQHAQGLVLSPPVEPSWPRREACSRDLRLGLPRRRA
jgi:DNA-binding transcriptional LysR family regulator